ncbi:MAG: BamA/TamA family outer membrane protein [Bacteroidota bacterium]
MMLLFCISVFSQEKEKIVKNDTLKNNKKVKTAFIPMLTYSNSFGVTFGVMTAGYYKLDRTDMISPLSSTLLLLKYSLNDTWFAILPNKFYFKEDKFRAKAVTGMGSINFQTYLDWSDVIGELPDGILQEPDNDGVFIDYNTKFQFLIFDLTTKVYKELYIGGKVIYSHNLTSFETDLKPDDDESLFGFGFSSEYDIRNSQTQPLTGFNSKFNTFHYLEALGSTSAYSKIYFEFNKYFPLQDRNTILLRAVGKIAFGDVPFSGKNVVGRDDLRGYSNGKFRADQVYDIQSEYRHWFSKRWGFVAFGGFATAVDKIGDFKFGDLLPGAGAGIRFLAIPSANVSIGVDVAVGKDDWGLYFRIGEAFTR